MQHFEQKSNYWLSQNLGALGSAMFICGAVDLKNGKADIKLKCTQCSRDIQKCSKNYLSVKYELTLRSKSFGLKKEINQYFRPKVIKTQLDIISVDNRFPATAVTSYTSKTQISCAHRPWRKIPNFFCNYFKLN